MAIASASTLAGYRDAVAALIQAGEPFGEIEQAIDGATDLTEDERAALWLFAFLLRDRDRRRLPARDHPILLTTAP